MTISQEINKRHSQPPDDPPAGANPNASHARFKAIFDQAPLFAGILSLDGTVLDANRMCLEACGYTPEQVVGYPFWNTPWWSGNPDTQAKLREATAQAADGKLFEAELPYVWADGSKRVVNFAVYPIRDEQGKVAFLYPIGEDVTERKDSERQAHQLQKRLEHQLRTFDAVFSSIADFTYIFDREGRFAYVNQSLLSLWGLGLEEAIGKNFFDLKYADPLAVRLQQQIQQVFDTGKSLRDETEYTSPTGVQGYYDYIFCPVFNDAGAVELVAGSTRDVSNRKRTENALRESEERLRTQAEALENQVQVRTRELEQRNEEILEQSSQIRELSRRLLQTQDRERRHIARELHDSAGQTLVVLIMQLARLVQNASRQAPEFVKEVEEIEQIAQQLNREIRTASYLLHPPLLDESGLRAAVEWYVRGLAERSGMEIDFMIASDFGRCDSEVEVVVFRLVQECLTNVHRHSESKQARIRITRQDGNVLIEVQDEGKGMSPERLAQVQSQNSGVGIRGMRERVHQLHGQLAIESSGTGTTVLVTIPAPKTPPRV